MVLLAAGTSWLGGDSDPWRAYSPTPPSTRDFFRLALLLIPSPLQRFLGGLVGVIPLPRTRLPPQNASNKQLSI